MGTTGVDHAGLVDYRPQARWRLKNEGKLLPGEELEFLSVHNTGARRSLHFFFYQRLGSGRNERCPPYPLRADYEAVAREALTVSRNTNPRLAWFIDEALAKP